MMQDQEPIEQGLQEDFERLGRLAGCRINPQDVTRRLKRRTARRVTVGSTVAVVLAAACITFVLSRPAGKSTEQVAQTPTKPAPQIARVQVEPLPKSAGKDEIREGLTKIFGQAKSVQIVKSSPDDLSYAMAGTTDLPSQQIRDQLDAMFANFDSVDVRQAEGGLKYTLIAFARKAGPH